MIEIRFLPIEYKQYIFSIECEPVTISGQAVRIAPLEFPGTCNMVLFTPIRLIIGEFSAPLLLHIIRPISVPDEL